MIWQILFVLLLVGAIGFFVADWLALVEVRVTEFEPCRMVDGSTSQKSISVLLPRG